jgi:dihydroneopterin aldolase
MARPRSIHSVPLSRREALLFEAGVKLGGVFHQYLGMPVSRSTAAGVARTIERAVGLQPYVARVRVRVDVTRGGPAGRGRFGYRYLTPEMLDVRVLLRDRAEEVEARLVHRPDLNYPLMHVVRLRSAPAGRRRRSGSRRR